MYTCLSRSSSLDGTLTLDDFDEDKIKQGMAKALQQEFRDLELLGNSGRYKNPWGSGGRVCKGKGRG